MKKDVLKKIALVFSLTTLTISYTPNIYSAIQVHDEEKQFLNTITTNIDHFVSFSTQWMNDFLNRSNNESYNTHIDRFEVNIKNFHAKVVQEINNHKPITQTHTKVIELTRSITSYLYNHANDVYQVFNRYRNNGTAIGLGFALQNVNKKYSAAQLQKNLQEAEKLLEQIDITIAQKVKHTIAKAKQQDQELSKRSVFDLLASIKHRINCKGPSAVIQPQMSKTKPAQSKSTPAAVQKLTPSQKKALAARQARKEMIAKKRAKRKK